MLNDELICAYLDGELDAEKQAMVEHWLASDAGAAARVERVRNADGLLRQAYPQFAREASDPLAAMIISPAANANHAAPRQWSMRVAAMAAACVLGVLIGHYAEPSNTLLSSGGEISRLLDDLPSGRAAAFHGGQFEVVLSLQSDAGELCRQYRIEHGNEAVDALACRSSDDWRVVVAAADSVTVEGAYIPAGADSPIDAAIARLGAATALDEDQERALIARSWRD